MLIEQLPFFQRHAIGYLTTVSGDDQISLPNARENKLINVKAYGKCEQSNLPAPDNPIDITCNNGVLKFTPNEFDVDEITIGYYRNKDNNGAITASKWNFLTGYMPVKPSTSYVLYGRRRSDDHLSSYNRIHWFDSSFDYISTSSYSKDAIGKGTSPSNAAYAQGSINESGATSIDTTKEIVEEYNWVFQQGTEEVTYIPYGDNNVYTDGTTETITDSLSNTATTQRLLSVGTYKDMQEVLGGNITRNVGIKVLNGTENIGTSNATYTVGIPDKVTTKNTLWCSHFQYSNKTSSQVEDQRIISFASTNIGFRYDTCTSAAEFKQWLSQQYTAGTPVIVVYPLATATTETAASQTLQVQNGNNTIEITQASLNNLELEATYRKGN